VITLQEASHGLFGAWRLLHLDRSALQHFRTDSIGFWNSFWAAAIVLPAIALETLLLSVDEAGPADSSGGPLDVLIYLQIFVIAWLLFPLVMAGVTDSINRGERFVVFVVAWNWSNIVRIAIVLPSVVIFAAEGVDTPGWGAVLYLAAQLATLVYAWSVARIALDVPPMTAVMVVVIELGLSIMLWLTAESLIG